MSSAAALPRASAGLRSRFSGMARVWQVVASFLAVFFSYWVYWLIAVPFIEPNVEQASTEHHASEEEVKAARQQVSTRQHDVAQYFPDGSWELDRPSIWQSDQSQARLLFKSIRPLHDGTVELRPCTVLFFPKGAVTEGPTAAQPIIMRAPGGATVRFDEPIDLKNVDLKKRRLMGGQLIGQITIYRKPRGVGTNDELEITTHDVEMQGDRIFTPHPVQFRLGRNHGSGRDMEILLATAEGAPAGTFKTGSIRSLELKHDVRMQLEMGGGPLAPGQAAPKRNDAEPTMDITCQGSFIYELARNAASFHDAVNVFRPNGLGESDQLTCELLTAFFESAADKPPAEQSAAVPPSEPDKGGLRMRRIEARGDPVVVRSPTRGIYVHCHGIDYSPGFAGAMGSLVALGPGFLQGTLPKDKSGNERPGNYDAKWTREFRFEPAEGNQHRASMVGTATVRFPQMGTIQADEIFAWLSPQNPPNAGAQGIRPTADTAPAVVAGPLATPASPAGTSEPAGGGWQLERLLARVHQDKKTTSQGQVVVDSPQLHAVTGQLEAWVERPPVLASTGPPTAVAGGAGQGPAQAKQPAAKSPQSQANPSQRFDLSGGRIRLQLVPEGEQLALSMVTVEHQARLHEATPARPGEKPLIVEGDRLHVVQANTPATRVTVNGRPGRLDAGGISLRGATIELEKQTNRLWIDGKGVMTMPIEQDLDGKPIARPQTLEIAWLGGMAFQGNSVVYQRNVVVSTASQVLRTEKMEAVFDRPIDFSNPNRGPGGKPEEKPQIAHVRCFGRSFLKSRQFDEQGQQTSVDDLNVVDLTLNKATGDVSGVGPGSLTHVGKGTDTAGRARPGGTEKPRAAEAGGGEDKLMYLNVQFESFLDGNLNRRMTRFGEPTKAVYGPVADWNAKLSPDDPTSLGPQGLVLDAKELEVREMPARERRDRGWFELKAKGNVVAEGAQFTARGDHLTYSEEKDQLVLRGDGLSPAEFFQDSPLDGTRRASKADELTYWFTLQRVQVTSFQSFDMQVPNTKAPKPKSKKSPF